MNAPAPEGLVILGSTGSIGKSTLDVVARHAERYRVVALAARRSWQVLAEQCRQFRPEYAVVTDPEVAASLSAALSGLDVKILVGAAALDEVAALPQAPIVMAAIVGAAGLNSTLAAVRAGKRLLLANKESLVMAGPLVMREVTRCGAVLLPVDSEHNAIFQCLPHGTGAGTTPPGVRRVLLTASGGPFRGRTAAELADVGVDDAALNTQDRGYLWFDVAKVEPTHERSLDDVKAKVEAEWRADQVAKALSAKAADLVKQVDGGADLASLAKGVGAEVKTAAGLKRSGGAELPANVVSAVFGLAPGKAGSAATPDGRLVFRITADATPAFSADEPGVKDQSDKLAQGLQEGLVEQFLASLKAQLGVKIDQRVLQAAEGG